jgi:hypothetical protein
MNMFDGSDADSVALRLLCEKAQERLERAWAAAEFAHRTVQLPDGTYVWAKVDEGAQPALR